MTEAPPSDRAAGGGPLARLWSRHRRPLISLLIVAVLYQNVDAMFGIWGLRIGRSTLPNVVLLEKLFYIYGVFGSVTTHSRRYVAFGSRGHTNAAPGAPSLGMEKLDIYRYFPQRRGEAHRRLGFTSYQREPERRAEGYRRIGDVMQRDYNREHPDFPISQVFIYLYEWPIDERGYDYRESEKTVRLVGHN